MRAVSETWAALAAGGDFRLEAKLKIGDVEYDKITAPRIGAPLLSSPLSVGSCMAKTLKVSTLTEDKLRSGTEVEVLGRLTNGTAATVCSEWLSFGVFHITTLDDKAAGGIVTIEGYDDMVLTNAAAFTELAETVTSVPMRTAVDDIASSIGVALDSRTVIREGAAYTMTVDRNLTKRQVLGYIAACHGGNWIITTDRKLRLVPLVSAGVAEGETVHSVPAVIGSLTIGEAVTVSGVQMTDTMGNQYAAGSGDGYTLTIAENPCACDTICGDLLATFEGLVYAPCTATTALYDPALEPGDHIAIGTRVTTILCNQEMKLDHAFRADITVPNSAALTSEFPYTNPIVQTVRNEVLKMANNLQVEGSISVDSLYASTGDIVDLTVNRICTSRRIQRYLARDMSNDDYIKIEGEALRFISASTEGSTEQAKHPNGSLLYWEEDVADAELTAGGWPHKDGVQIFTTTKRTEWPVTVYSYTELVKRQIFFSDIDGVSAVLDYFGDDSTGYNRGWIALTAAGLSFTYRPNSAAEEDGDDIGIMMNENGYMDLFGLRQPTEINLERSDSTITMTTIYQGDMEAVSVIKLDAAGYPTEIVTDGVSCKVSWEGFDGI